MAELSQQSEGWEVKVRVTYYYNKILISYLLNENALDIFSVQEDAMAQGAKVDSASTLKV